MNHVRISEFVNFILVSLGYFHGGEQPQTPTLEEIEAIATGLRKVGQWNQLDDDEFAFALAQAENKVQINNDEPQIEVIGSEVHPWLNQRRREIDWVYSDAYHRYLRAKGFPPRVIESLSAKTDKILDLMGDPGVSNVWKRRGLVIGDVQSGKTSTYLSLINKAADAGYKLIVILGGHTEALRVQTQKRVDEGFIGRDSGRASAPGKIPIGSIGVGVHRRGDTFPTFRTTRKQDFRIAGAGAGGMFLDDPQGLPVVLVIKKNKIIMQNLVNWVHQQNGGSKLSIPLMVLDDESDYASVDTSPDSKDNPTAINRLIRELLETSKKNAYIGFTATPFANIFIDSDSSDDLFPRDFIVSLQSPSNYVGAKRVFLGEYAENHQIQLINDCDLVIPVKHKQNHRFSELPLSLLEALDYFMIANAMRDLESSATGNRGMLINVSKYARIQNKVFELVNEYVASQKSAIGFSDGKTQVETREKFQKVFDKFKGNFDFEFEDVWMALGDAVAGLEVMLVNSNVPTEERNLIETQSNDDSRMIVVGGNVLSRGVTIEGLMVSYFHRRVAAYDTLLQMARWFGYRDGYNHLCQIWMREDSAEWFEQVFEAVEDLKASLEEMARQRMRPDEFGLMVRSHPGSLMITAANKRRATVTRDMADLSLDTRSIELTKFSSSVNTRNKNWNAGIKIVRSCGEKLERLEIGQTWIAREVPTALLAEFWNEFSPHISDKNALLWAHQVRDAILQSSVTENQLFDLMIIGGSGNQIDTELNFPLQGFKSVERQVTVDFHSDEEAPILRVGGSRSRVAGPMDLTRLFSGDEKTRIETAFRSTDTSDRDFLTPDAYVRSKLARPVLTLYFVKPKYVMQNQVNGSSDPIEVTGLPDSFLAINLAFNGNPKAMGRGRWRVTLNAVAIDELARQLSFDFEDDGVEEESDETI